MCRFFNYKRCFIAIIILDLMLLGRISFLSAMYSVPDDIVLFPDEEVTYVFGLPIKISFNEESSEVFSINGDKGVTDSDVSGSMSIAGSVKGSYSANASLFGIFSLKEVSINIVDPVLVYPVGKCSGIYVETDGIMVLGTGDIEVSDSDDTGYNIESPCKNILKEGDYILKVNNEDVDSNKQLIEAVQNADDDKIILTIRRDGEIIEAAINRVCTKDGIYKLGIWIRENLQGIGTITYIDEEGNFGALGHGINDSTSGVILQINDGGLYTPYIKEIIKGRKQNPGELYGVISYANEDYWGKIEKNTDNGIFGTIEQDAYDDLIQGSDKMEIKLKTEINKGRAYIISDLEGEPKKYEIEILQIDLNSTNNKSMIIEITDSTLLELTNGIIQGMSGSPIIQDGKFIGAVTHVFVNDPTKGYAVFAENMLNQ